MSVRHERGGDVLDPYLAPVPEPESVGRVNQPEPAEENPVSTETEGADPAWWNPVARRSARLDAGRTWRVARRVRDVAEERRLADEESPRVLRAERELDDDERLEEIESDPRSEARSNRRVRTWVQRLIGASVAGGLVISSSTAQTTITDTMNWSIEHAPVGFVAAFGADPVLGLVLFAVLFVRSLATNRGVALPAAAQQVFRRVEMSLFALVAALNGGPAVAGLLRSLVAVVAPQALRVLDILGHGLMSLVIHLLGPVLVGLAVYALPHVMDLLRQISVATQSRLHTGGPGPVRGSSPLVDRSNGVPAKWHPDLAAVLAAIDDGRLPVNPSGGRIHALVGGDAAKKAPLREAVAGYRPEGVAA